MKRLPRIGRLLTPRLGGRIRPYHAARKGSVRVPLVGWVYYLLAACCTPLLVAIGVIVVAPSLGLMLLGIQTGFLYLGYTAAGLILAGMGLAMLAHPRLEVAVETPACVECGQNFQIRYHVKNTGALPALDLTLESLLFPNPVEVRLESVHVPFVEAGASCRLAGTGTARRRGCYQLPPFRWDTRFPMGLWRCGRTDWKQVRHLCVYPRFVRLDDLRIPLGARNRQETHTARHLSRSALEFHACREFRQGDAVRHLHPRSSARRGVPVVKEFLAEGHGRTAVIVDTLAPSLLAALWSLRPDPHCEAVLSLGASIVEYLARQDHVVEFLVAGPGLYRFESAGRMGFFQEVLDILAGLEPVFKDPLPVLQPLLIDEISAIQSVCLVLGSWNQQRAALVGELEAQQVGVKLVLVQQGKARMVDGLPEHTTVVQVRDVQQGRIREL